MIEIHFSLLTLLSSIELSKFQIYSMQIFYPASLKNVITKYFSHMLKSIKLIKKINRFLCYIFFPKNLFLLGIFIINRKFLTELDERFELNKFENSIEQK